MSWEM